MSDDIIDVTYLLFGQVMSGLDSDDRNDVVDSLYEGEFGAALYCLLAAVRRRNVSADPELVARALRLCDEPERVAPAPK